MNCSFKKNHSRLFSLTLVLLLLIGMLAGCKSGGDDASTTPSSEDNVPPGLVDVKPTEETTTPPETTEPMDESAAIVIVDTANVRQTPSEDAPVIGYLDKDTKVTIVREVSIGGTGWTLIREGWVTTASIEKSYIPDETEPNSGVPTIPTPAQTDNKNNNTNNNTNNNNNTTTNNNTNTTNIKGVVTAGELNIRKEASQDSDRVGGYVYGDRITILETKNGWGRTDKGWVSLNYVYQDGTTGQKTCKGVVIASQLNVRSGPGVKYDKVDAVNYGGRVNVLEQITVDGTVWGCIKGGWISMDHVYVDGTKSTGAGEGTCTGDAVNIRSGPGTAYGAVGSANTGDALTIYTQIEIGDMTWGYVEKGNVKGWMSMQYANMG